MAWQSPRMSPVETRGPATSEPEGIGLFRAFAHSGRQRRHRGRLIEPDIAIELLRQ